MLSKGNVQYHTKGSLVGVLHYLDNITLCGKNQSEHDTKEYFLETAKQKNITYPLFKDATETFTQISLCPERGSSKI